MSRLPFLEFLEANRQWLFSGIGIAILGFFLRAFYQALSGRRPPKLRVRVRGAILDHPALDFLTITVENFSSFPAFIERFLLGLRGGQCLFEGKDGLTGQFQSKREVPPGDSLTFNILAEGLRGHMAEKGLEVSDFTRAYVEDAVGRRYYASRKETRAAIRGAIVERKQ